MVGDDVVERMARAACRAKVKNSPADHEQDPFVDEFWRVEVDSVRAALNALGPEYEIIRLRNGERYMRVAEHGSGATADPASGKEEE